MHARANNIVILSAFIIVLFGAQYISSVSDQKSDDTCESFIKSVEEADETMDPIGPQTYNDIAETIYAALNNAVVKAGLAALPLHQDPKARANRAAVVIRECRASSNEMYHNAVANAYVELRRRVGLPTELRVR